jgi:hypothetical protein
MSSDVHAFERGRIRWHALAHPYTELHDFVVSALRASPSAADIPVVKHIRLESDDIPVLPILMDRRCQPDRRTTWRGGRRDTDWHQRPLGAWDRFGGTPSPRWQKVLASLHLW